MTASDWITIYVLQTAPPSPYTAQISLRPDGATNDAVTLLAPATLVLFGSIQFGDASGIASKIEFAADGTTIGTVTAPDPSSGEFIFVWRKVSAGSYAITAKLTDLNGFVSISDPFNVTVATPPTTAVTLQSPIGEQVVPLIAGGVLQSIQYAASMTDPGGTVASVEFDDNYRYLTRIASPPYSGVVSSPSWGLHVITASALIRCIGRLREARPGLW